jgi:hypothetical protein
VSVKAVKQIAESLVEHKGFGHERVIHLESVKKNPVDGSHTLSAAGRGRDFSSVDDSDHLAEL